MQNNTLEVPDGFRGRRLFDDTEIDSREYPKWPYIVWNSSSDFCTYNVSDTDLFIAKELETVWSTATNMQLGKNHDINIYRIVLLYGKE